LHDVCERLARAPLESHAFGSSIQQQHTTFGGGARVWSNRGAAPWTVADGRTLPEYGFFAQTPDAQAGVVLAGGRRLGFARSPGCFFADARAPDRGDGGIRAGRPEPDPGDRLPDFGPLATDGAFRLRHDRGDFWELVPLPGSLPFRAELSLAKLGAPGATVREVGMSGPLRADARPPRWSQDGDTLRLACDGAAFACRIVFAGDSREKAEEPAARGADQRRGAGSSPAR
jgi:hypothetical protein